MKKFITILLAVILVICVCAGCKDNESKTTAQTDGTEHITLRILTEGSANGVNFNTKYIDLLIRQAATDFEIKHENVTLEIEQIPLEAESREVALSRLRTEIIAGDGPDIYYLPTRAIQTLSVGFEEVLDDPLFPDVSQAMRNGLFYDISAFYDADTTLEKDCLVPGVMDAGVLDDGRYVLPLRYNYPVAYVDLDALHAAGYDESIFSSGVIHLLNTVVQEDMIANDVQPPDYISQAVLNFFPDAIDYENQRILVTREELADFMESYQAYKEDNKGYYFVSPPEYILDGRHWAQYGAFIHFDNIENAIQQAKVAKSRGMNLGMFPITATDGRLVADVTFFGAVGAECAHPEIAYEFLSTCLSEKNQWGTDAQFGNSAALVADGFPVRTKGAAGPICKSFPEAYAGKLSPEDQVERFNQMESTELTDEDVPLLQREVDGARFPIGLEEEFSEILLYQINPSTTREEMEALAEEFIRKLEWHLGEG